MSTPLTALHFHVSWGDSQNSSAFAEVSGLTSEAEVIEYRAGTDPTLSKMKIPGLKKFGNVTMKRGIMPKDSGNGLFEWFGTIRSGQVTGRAVVISLLNEERNPVMTWSLRNAWPVKVEGPALNAKGTDIAIESVEFAHEGLEIAIVP